MWLTILGHSPPQQGSQDGKYLKHLVISTHFLSSFFFFFYRVQDSNPRNGAAHSRLSLPISVNTIKKILHRHISTIQLNLDNLIETPSLVILECVKLTSKTITTLNLSVDSEVGGVVDGPSAVCILILIPLSWEGLWRRSESHSGDIL